MIDWQLVEMVFVLLIDLIDVYANTSNHWRIELLSNDRKNAENFRSKQVDNEL